MKDKRVDDENDSKFPSKNMHKFRKLLQDMDRIDTDTKPGLKGKGLTVNQAAMRQTVIFISETYSRCS